MKTISIILFCLILFPILTVAGEKENLFVKEKLIPLAQAFIKRNNLPSADFGTNNIKRCEVDFFTDGRSGCTADIKLKTGYLFSFYSDGTNTDVWHFHDGITLTYYALEDAPKGKIDAIKALNLRNKLNKKTAMEVAKNFFRLQGHKEENFHPAELQQSYWSGGNDNRGGELPYYEVKWFRKDITQAERDTHEAKYVIPSVKIEVSGIDSHLISYSKGFLPIGKDF